MNTVEGEGAIITSSDSEENAAHLLPRQHLLLHKFLLALHTFSVEKYSQSRDVAH